MVTLKIAAVIFLCSAPMASGCLASPDASADLATSGAASAQHPAHTGLPAGFTFCAAEYDWCNFQGTRTVAYGANGVWFYQTETNGVMCNNETFGDPAVGVDKLCYVR